jgi:hypothetical protein
MLHAAAQNATAIGSTGKMGCVSTHSLASSVNKADKCGGTENVDRRRWLVFLLILGPVVRQSGLDYCLLTEFFPACPGHIVAAERYGCGGDARTWKSGKDLPSLTLGSSFQFLFCAQPILLRRTFRPATLCPELLCQASDFLP